MAEATVTPIRNSPSITLANPFSTNRPPAQQPTANPEISIGQNGYIHGIDGMLDQVSNALVRQAKTELFPSIQQDTRLQLTIGKGIGQALAKPFWVLVGIAAVYVGFQLFRPKD